FARLEVEGGMVPGAADLSGGAEPFGQRAAVVGATTAQGVDRVGGPDHDDGFAVHETGHGLADPQLVAGDSVGPEIRQVGLPLLSHGPPSSRLGPASLH